MEDYQGYSQQFQGDQPQNDQPPYGNQQQYDQQPYGNQMYDQQSYGNQPYAQPVKPVVYDVLPTGHIGVAAAALACGILGIVFFWFPVVDLGLNVAGIICAIVTLSKKYDGKGMAIAGLVISIIGLLISLFFMLCFFVALLYMM